MKGTETTSNVIRFAKRNRVPILVAVHLVIFCSAFAVAFCARFDFELPVRHTRLFFMGMAVAAGLKLVTFYWLGSFHGWWRYVSFSDVIALGKASLLAQLLIISVDHFFLPAQIPRSVILVDWLLTVIVMGGLRSIWRVWDERIVTRQQEKRHCALFLGTDSAAAKLVHLINAEPTSDLRITGLLSESAIFDRRVRFGDLRIVGSANDLPQFAADYRIRTLLVRSGDIQAASLRKLLEKTAIAGVDLRIIPPLADHFGGHQHIPIREVRVEDLLRRDEVAVDGTRISSLIEARTVLVSGAGGSIGAELCRQIVKYKPASLVLLGRGENRIYQIERELRGLAPDVDFVAKIASVTDEPRIREIFQEHVPSLVLHAAAHKHVPLTEANVGEAVYNNVRGAQVMADVAVEYGVAEFVQISSDKAVNPTSVMGCTKQIADRYCLAMDAVGKTRFVVTRFGNVLGSAGSVVPLFKEQIRKGGPITVTDPRMTRFFMTIPEASQLVLQAASLGKGGEVFVLEMGEQIRIEEMARDLTRLAGLAPDAIDIVYTGIRPGEKLYEELFYSEHDVLPTDHPKVMCVYHPLGDIRQVQTEVEGLLDVAFGAEDEIRAKLCECVPEYQDERIKNKKPSVIDEKIAAAEPATGTLEH